MSFNIDDYVDVAERIRSFYDRFPDGRLTTVDWDVKPDLGGKVFVWVHAKAYRTPDDPLPGDGIAWEPVPGPTQFTKDSELMNAQTAAWGRAIVALGFETKKIASKQEVQARNGDPLGFTESRADAPQAGSGPGAIEVKWGKHKGKLVRDVPASYWEWWLNSEMAAKPDFQEFKANVELHLGLTASPVASGPDPYDDIPFMWSDGYGRELGVWHDPWRPR